MSAPGDFEPFVPAGMASLGIEVDEVELAVMRAAHEAYWPAIGGLLELDLSNIEPEPAANLSRPPEQR